MPSPPVCTHYLVNEATIEGVHLILKENPQGVLCAPGCTAVWPVRRCDGRPS
jgi:hypothetical protein